MTMDAIKAWSDHLALRFGGQRLAYFGNRVLWDNGCAPHRRDESIRRAVV